MSKRIENRARRSASEKIEAAIVPIERLDLILYAAWENFLDREIKPEAANHVAVALDMLESEVAHLRRLLYGATLAP